MIIYRKDLEKYVLQIIRENPYSTLKDIRSFLKERGIMISYTKLKKIVNELADQGKIRYFKYSRKILYIPGAIHEN